MYLTCVIMQTHNSSCKIGQKTRLSADTKKYTKQALNIFFSQLYSAFFSKFVHFLEKMLDFVKSFYWKAFQSRNAKCGDMSEEKHFNVCLKTTLPRSKISKKIFIFLFVSFSFSCPAMFNYIYNSETCEDFLGKEKTFRTLNFGYSWVRVLCCQVVS